jgi:hypothetical protein
MNRTVRKSKRPSGKKIYSLPDNTVSGNLSKSVLHSSFCFFVTVEAKGRGGEGRGGEGRGGKGHAGRDQTLPTRTPVQ